MRAKMRQPPKRMVRRRGPYGTFVSHPRDAKLTQISANSRVRMAPVSRIGTKMGPNNIIFKIPSRLVGCRTNGLNGGHLLLSVADFSDDGDDDESSSLLLAMVGLFLRIF
jgi:hypothetical protein